jgi:hypothetical protein
MCLTVKKSRDGKTIMVSRNGRFDVSQRDGRGDWVRKLEQVSLGEAESFMRLHP